MAEESVKETTTCPFCKTEGVEIKDLGANTRYQKRRGFKCPKCGAVSVVGSSEWMGEDIPALLNPFSFPFPLFRRSFLDPFENFPSVFEYWPGPFTRITHDLFNEANALFKSAEKPAQVEEVKK